MRMALYGDLMPREVCQKMAKLGSEILPQRFEELLQACRGVQESSAVRYALEIDTMTRTDE